MVPCLSYQLHVVLDVLYPHRTKRRNNYLPYVHTGPNRVFTPGYMGCVKSSESNSRLRRCLVQISGDIHSNMFALVSRESNCDEPLLPPLSRVWENCGRLLGFGEMAGCAFKSNQSARRFFIQNIYFRDYKLQRCSKCHLGVNVAPGSCASGPLT